MPAGRLNKCSSVSAQKVNKNTLTSTREMYPTRRRTHSNVSAVRRLARPPATPAPDIPPTEGLLLPATSTVSFHSVRWTTVTVHQTANQVKKPTKPDSTQKTAYHRHATLIRI